MFDYFGVLISIIMGLALTHLLRGLAKLIQMRHEVEPYWVQVVWTLTVTIFVLAIWWGMFWWKDLEHWNIGWFLFLASYSIVLFMWASMLYPPEFPHGYKCQEYFFHNRAWFFGFGIAVMLMDMVETVEKQDLSLRNVPSEYIVFLPLILVIYIIGMTSRSRRVHAVLAVATLIAVVAYPALTKIASIAAHGHP